MEVKLSGTFSLKKIFIILLQWTNVSSKGEMGTGSGYMKQRTLSVSVPVCSFRLIGQPIDEKNSACSCGAHIPMYGLVWLKIRTNLNQKQVWDISVCIHAGLNNNMDL